MLDLESKDHETVFVSTFLLSCLYIVCNFLGQMRDLTLKLQSTNRAKDPKIAFTM